MAETSINRAAGTNSSVVVECCQVCGSRKLQTVQFYGYHPPVNHFYPIGTKPREQASFPSSLLVCRDCDLVQLGLIVDPAILFPPSYPYTSGTTRILRENFADLYKDVQQIRPLGPDDLVIDIGSNDGTLLSNFHNGGHRVLGIEPTDVGAIARSRGIDTMTAFFGPESAAKARASHGRAKIVTAANVFAHIEDVDSIIAGILDLLDEDGMFISESHYLIPLLETLQYDTVYHEHLRYYSLTSLKFLLEKHGLEVVHAKAIPTHGGSIRVFAARKGQMPVQDSVAKILATEPTGDKLVEALETFRGRVAQSKLDLLKILADVKRTGARIFGISAPSRSSTLINYVGIDDGMVDYICEIKNSLKIGKYLPGTQIPVVDEQILFDEQPEYALIFSWHIADELMAILKKNGFKGRFIVPLPSPRVV